MKHLLVLAAASAMLLSGCAIAEQARPMTEAEKAAAVQIAETAGFSRPNFISEQRDLFGGNYQEYIVAEQPSGTSNPYSPLVEQYRGILEAHPTARTHREGTAVVQCREYFDVRDCGFGLILDVGVSGNTQTLSIGVSATSEGVSRISVSPYYDSPTVYPAPPTIPSAYQEEAQQ